MRLIRPRITAARAFSELETIQTQFKKDLKPTQKLPHNPWACPRSYALLRGAENLRAITFKRLVVQTVYTALALPHLTIANAYLRANGER
jgi:hypothetical protein